MGLISKTAKMKWNSVNKKTYELKGYIYTKMGDKFDVRVSDLSDGCGALVEVECDCETCNSPLLKPIVWRNYKRYLHDDNKYYCTKCASKLFSNENVRLKRLENGLSFKQWCINNLSKEESDNVLLRWDYKLNVNKEGCLITPDDISFNSKNYNHKGFWFKCLDHPEHESELQNIIGFTKGQKGSISCNQCKAPAITNPEIIKYFVNTEEAYNYVGGLSKQVLMKCPNCGFIKPIRIMDFIHKGFGCRRCGDGTSFPEKIMYSVLEQLDINFKPQLSRSTFKWCEGYKYDFYLPDNKIIIEIQGLQHYEHSFGRIKSNKKVRSLLEEQENDRLKHKLAVSNGINDYMIIDCRISELEFVKENILNSKLSELFDLSNINWTLCSEYAYSSSVKKVCEVWNNGNKDIKMIAFELNLGVTTVRRYLKQGVSLEWCNYIPVTGRHKQESIIMSS